MGSNFGIGEKWIVCWFLLGVGLGRAVWGQPILDPQLIRNQQVAYVNEGLHIMWLLQPAIERQDSCLRQAIRGLGELPPFPGPRLLREDMYQGVHVGICPRIGQVRDGAENLENLYQRLTRQQAKTPEADWVSLMASLSKCQEAFSEVIATSEALARTDDPIQQEWLLRRMEQLYQDLVESLLIWEHALAGQQAPLPAELLDLAEMVVLARQIPLLLQRGSPEACADLYQRLSQQRERVFQMIPHLSDSVSLFPHRLDKGLNYLIRYVDKLLPILAQGKGFDAISARQQAYQQAVRWLNHAQYGLLAYYNQFLELASSPLPHQVEIPPWLRLKPPILRPVSPLSFDDQQVDLQGCDWAASAIPVADGQARSHVIWLIDASASMGQGGYLGQLRRLIPQVLGDLNPQDQCSLVRYAGRSQVLAERVVLADAATFLQALAGLQAGGKTQVNRGLRAAQQLGLRQVHSGERVRFILVTDGAFTWSKRWHRMMRRSQPAQVQWGIWLLPHNRAPQIEGAATVIQGVEADALEALSSWLTGNTP